MLHAAALNGSSTGVVEERCAIDQLTAQCSDCLVVEYARSIRMSGIISVSIVAVSLF